MVAAAPARELVSPFLVLFEQDLVGSLSIDPSKQEPGVVEDMFVQRLEPGRTLQNDVVLEFGTQIVEPKLRFETNFLALLEEATVSVTALLSRH